MFSGETNDSFSGVFRKTFFFFLLFCFAGGGENSVPALEQGFSRSVIGFSCSLTLVTGLCLASSSSTSESAEIRAIQRKPRSPGVTGVIC